jgi:hypothetical protein
MIIDHVNRIGLSLKSPIDYDGEVVSNIILEKNIHNKRDPDWNVYLKLANKKLKFYRSYNTIDDIKQDGLII